MIQEVQGSTEVRKRKRLGLRRPSGRYRLPAGAAPMRPGRLPGDGIGWRRAARGRRRPPHPGDSTGRVMRGHLGDKGGGVLGLLGERGYPPRRRSGFSGRGGNAPGRRLQPWALALGVAEGGLVTESNAAELGQQVDARFEAAIGKLEELHKALRAAVPRGRNAETRASAGSVSEAIKLLGAVEGKIRIGRAFACHGFSRPADLPVRFHRVG